MSITARDPGYVPAEELPGDVDTDAEAREALGPGNPDLNVDGPTVESVERSYTAFPAADDSMSPDTHGGPDVENAILEEGPAYGGNHPWARGGPV